ncbi:hypothetical protein STCU_12251 [Strigomonas culicis]|uniref:Uncharacterized protein n=1 Tax=Strigomonas culicis TaxID=28005 RepID=S9UXE6_9TRYP|nr:hypothetical protein STCU_12251 [Strigomonas culicis]|eukprot:EPY15205.1 hypothetical protein STCU_12251 [Strigomonas culicis]
MLCADLGALPLYADGDGSMHGHVDVATVTTLFSVAILATSGLERQDFHTPLRSGNASGTEPNASVSALLSMPPMRTHMSYPAFLLALALLADACYPRRPPRRCRAGRRRRSRWRLRRRRRPPPRRAMRPRRSPRPHRGSCGWGTR